MHEASSTNKSSKLDLAIAAQGYDIIILTETHLDSSIPDGGIFPSNYSVFRRDRKLNGRYGGGVLIATRDHIKAVPRHSTERFRVHLRRSSVHIQPQSHRGSFLSTTQ